MNLSTIFVRLFLLIIFLLSYACDKIEVIGPRPSLPVHERTMKPRTPMALGSIRGYIGEEYFSFEQHIEKVQPVDSFSNCLFYGACDDTYNQINLIRCDQEYVLAIYILGVSPDSLPTDRPVPEQFGRYTEIQFYPFQDWNSTSPGHYSLIDFYGKSVFITDNSDDVLTGTFEGVLRSPSGSKVRVSDGEFKIRIFRKYLPCGQ
jgi:hypothetical protein